MPTDEKFDFFLSRRGSVAAMAREVVDVLIERGYKVVVQDYDFPLGGNLIEAMHEAIKNARDLIVLFTHDYALPPDPQTIMIRETAPSLTRRRHPVDHRRDGARQCPEDR